MSRDTDISDETLTAYIDGVLSNADAARVSGALADSPSLASRLEALDVPLDDLCPAFEAMLGDGENALAPQRTLKAGIAAAFFRELGRCLDGVVADGFHRLIGKFDSIFRGKGNMLYFST